MDSVTFLIFTESDIFIFLLTVSVIFDLWESLNFDYRISLSSREKKKRVENFCVFLSCLLLLLLLFFSLSLGEKKINHQPTTYFCCVVV